MKYNAYYNSYNLNRKNVLVYGKEKFDLFQITIDVLGHANYAEHVNLEEIDNINLTKDDLVCEYYITCYCNKNDDNLTIFINENQRLFEIYNEYKNAIANLQNFNNELSEQVDINSVNTVEYFLSIKSDIESFTENYLTELSTKYGFQFEKVEDGYNIEEEDVIKEKFLQAIKEEREERELALSLIEEETEDEYSENEENIENEESVE